MMFFSTSVFVETKSVGFFFHFNGIIYSFLRTIRIGLHTTSLNINKNDTKIQKEKAINS